MATWLLAFLRGLWEWKLFPPCKEYLWFGHLQLLAVLGSPETMWQRTLHFKAFSLSPSGFTPLDQKWFMTCWKGPVITALRLQCDCHKPEATLGCIARPWLQKPNKKVCFKSWKYGGVWHTPLIPALKRQTQTGLWVLGHPGEKQKALNCDRKHGIDRKLCRRGPGLLTVRCCCWCSSLLLPLLDCVGPWQVAVGGIFYSRSY